MLYEENNFINEGENLNKKWEDQVLYTFYPKKKQVFLIFLGGRGYAAGNCEV